MAELISPLRPREPITLRPYQNTILNIEAQNLAKLAEMQTHPLPNGHMLVAGSGNTELSYRIAELLKEPVYNGIEKFSDESVARLPREQKKHLIVLQSVCPPDVAGNLMEAFMIADAGKRSGLDITGVFPYLGYMRQDRKEQSGTSITGKLVADLLTLAGYKRITTLDIHAEQETGFFNIPVDILYASKPLIPHVIQLIQNEGLNYKLSGPDTGSEKRVISWGKRINKILTGKDEEQEIVSFRKARDYANGGKSRIVSTQGECKGFDMFLIDDMLAGGKTLDECGGWLMNHGANSVTSVVTHGLFLGRKAEDGRLMSPVELLDKSPIKRFIVTDSVDIPEEIRNHSKVQVVSVAPLLAEAICRNITGAPLTDLVE